MTETKPFARADLAQAPTKLLRNGRVATAVVTRVEIDGRSWTVKDFSARPWWVRTFIAPFLLRRELSILARLRGVEGVSQESFRIDREAMAVLFMEGSNIGREPERVTPAYLEAFEELLRAMHARGVVHLDERGTGNVMIRPASSTSRLRSTRVGCRASFVAFSRTSTCRAPSRNGFSSSLK